MVTSLSKTNPHRCLNSDTRLAWYPGVVVSLFISLLMKYFTLLSIASSFQSFTAHVGHQRPRARCFSGIYGGIFFPSSLSLYILFIWRASSWASSSSRSMRGNFPASKMWSLRRVGMKKQRTGTFVACFYIPGYVP